MSRSRYIAAKPKKTMISNHETDPRSMLVSNSVALGLWMLTTYDLAMIAAQPNFDIFNSVYVLQTGGYWPRFFFFFLLRITTWVNEPI